jgi:hypothetical protein
MFLTVPSTIVKGSDITVQISVPNLLAFGKIDDDLYYSDKSNWKRISIEFGDGENDQKRVTFADYTGQTGLINLTFQVTSEFISNTLFFAELIVYDKANGFLTIGRNEISPVDRYDMDFI